MTLFVSFPSSYTELTWHYWCLRSWFHSTTYVVTKLFCRHAYTVNMVVVLMTSSTNTQGSMSSNIFTYTPQNWHNDELLISSSVVFLLAVDIRSNVRDTVSTSGNFCSVCSLQILITSLKWKGSLSQSLLTGEALVLLFDWNLITCRPLIPTAVVTPVTACHQCW